MSSFSGLRASASLPLLCVLSALLQPAHCVAETILSPAAGRLIFETQGSSQTSSTCTSPGATCLSAFSTGQSVSFSGDGAGTLIGSTQYGADPSVASTLTFSGVLDPLVQFLQISEVGYQFEVDGPADETVPITIAATGSSSINHLLPSGQGITAEGVLEVYDSSDDILLTAGACSGSPYTSICATLDGYGTSSNHINRSDSFDLDETLDITTDTVYTMAIETDVLAQSFSSSSYSSPDLSATATVDPTITLDTTDPEYSLQVSAPAPAPEPNYLPLTVPFAALGMAFNHLRNRRGLVAQP